VLTTISTSIILLTLSLNLQAQTKDQKEFMQYCMHGNPPQKKTIFPKVENLSKILGARLF